MANISKPDHRVLSTATEAWLKLLMTLTHAGRYVTPRGMGTVEVPHAWMAFDMMRPIVQCEPRKLSWKFLTGEALWILSGSDLVEDIAPYNKYISDFSDDGEVFFGAYGPKVVGQLNYVVRNLVYDPESRQAVISIWRENPPKTLDVPCTCILQFMIRNGALNCHVYMRSSDAWLGVPYDWFNFSMIALKVACEVNREAAVPPIVKLGAMYWTAGSSHLYEKNWQDVVQCMSWYHDHTVPYEIIAQEPMRGGDWDAYERELLRARDSKQKPRLYDVT